MLFVLTILPLALGLTIVLMSIMRKLRSQPVFKQVEMSMENESAAGSGFPRTSRGLKISSIKSQKEVSK